jgi:MFS family permease
LVVKLASGGNLEAGIVLAAYPFLEALGALIAGRWSDTLGRKTTLVTGYFVRSLAMLLLAWAFYTHEAPWLEALLNGVIGFTTAFILTASLAMATDLTEVRNRGLGMGGFEFINLGSYGVGYLLGSFLYTVFTGPAAYLTIALLTTAATPIFAKFLPETRPAAPVGGKFLLSVLPPSAVFAVACLVCSNHHHRPRHVCAESSAGGERRQQWRREPHRGETRRESGGGPPLHRGFVCARRRGYLFREACRQVGPRKDV